MKSPVCLSCGIVADAPIHTGGHPTRCHAFVGPVYIWAWSKRPIGQNRKGERCRVVARGEMNSAHVVFESDGYEVITSRNGLRRIRA
jgi:hypothetical protein